MLTQQQPPSSSFELLGVLSSDSRYQWANASDTQMFLPSTVAQFSKLSTMCETYETYRCMYIRDRYSLVT